MPRLPAASVLLALALAGCQSVNPDYNPAKPHHRPDGFVNNYLDSARIGEGFWRWQWARLTEGIPPDDPERVQRVPVGLEHLRANRSEINVTWFGHSSAMWQVGGLNVLTDPHFSERASPVSFAGPKRETPLPVQLAQLPRIDVVLISHNHYDHLDLPTVKALQAQPGGPPLFIVPLGIDRWLREQGATQVQGLDWWDSRTVGGVRISLVPVQHWSSRSPFDRLQTLWGGFVAQVDGFSMFYAGDTGYSKDFQDIQARFGPMDFAQIPVGCYLPRWFMGNQHVNEDEAVRIHLDLQSRQSLGVHWGAFRLCDDPVASPLDGLPKALAKAGVAPERFRLLRLGETMVLRPAR